MTSEIRKRRDCHIDKLVARLRNYSLTEIDARRVVEENKYFIFKDIFGHNGVFLLFKSETFEACVSRCTGSFGGHGQAALYSFVIDGCNFLADDPDTGTVDRQLAPVNGEAVKVITCCFRDW